MTDRVDHLVVGLSEDLRVDDAEVLMAAIRQLRGVSDVRPHISDYALHLAGERARSDLAAKLWEVLRP